MKCFPFKKSLAGLLVVLGAHHCGLARAQSVHLDAGQDAPFAGQLVSDAEHVRRERINERNAEAFDFTQKHRGDAVLPKPALVAVVAGSVALGVALGVAVTLAAKK